jgi:fibronectin-binding autotransporter adhesin
MTSPRCKRAALVCTAALLRSLGSSLLATSLGSVTLVGIIWTCLFLASNVFAGNAKDFFQNTSMTASGNYSPSGTPTNSDDVRITRTSASLTITAASLSMESLSVDNGNTFTISNATSTANNSTLTLGNTAGFTNVFSGVANDLIYLTGNSTLTIQGPNSSTGSGVLNITLASSGNFNTGTGSTVTISSVISGSGQSITKTGGGTVTLSGANTYSGGTTLNAGTLQLGSSSTGNITNGPVGTGTLTLNGGTLSSDVGDFITTRSIANAITFGGDVTFGTNTNFGALALSGAGTLTGTRTLTFVADVTYSGNIGESGGSFGIVKNGSGTLKLSGFNTYSGGTTVNAGLLWLNTSSALGSSSGALTVNGGIVDLGGNSISVGNLTGSGGTIWNNLNAQNTAVTLTVGNGNTGGGNYQGVIANNNGASNGTLALTKTGNGTITLSGANTYSGGTTVNGGTLLVTGGNVGSLTNSGTGTGNVSVSGSGTTLAGGSTSGTTGSILGTVNVGSSANLSPGTSGDGTGSTAILHTGALTLSSGSTFSLNLNNTTAGSGYDQVISAGAITFNGSTLSVAVGGTLQLNDKFFILENSTMNPNSTGAFTNGTTVISGGYTFLINYLDNGDAGTIANDISLTVTVVPEPSSWAAATLALLSFLCAQRRKLSRGLLRARCSDGPAARLSSRRH